MLLWLAQCLSGTFFWYFPLDPESEIPWSFSSLFHASKHLSLFSYFCIIFIFFQLFQWDLGEETDKYVV